MVTEKVVLCDAKFKVKNIKELAFDATNVAFAKDTGAECPVNVLECRIVQILGGADKRTQKYSFMCPLLQSDVEMRLGPVDVDKGAEDGWHRHFSACDDVGDEGGELCELHIAEGSTSP